MKKSSFNFAKFNDDTYLMTNYAGRFAFLPADEFHAFCNDERIDPAIENRLIESYFCIGNNTEKYMREYADAIRDYRHYLFSGTGLHIFVLTSQCNMKCVYCQASTHEYGQMMSKEIAEKCVNLALQSPNNYLSFEFQGGEPLLNFDVLRHIVEYTEAQKVDKHIEFNLVSNLTTLTDEMIEFIKAHNINISTSLDGFETLQNLNRVLPCDNGYKVWKRNFDKVKRITGKSYGAIQTTTRKSLSYPTEIVDEYINCGFSRVFVRPLTPLGYASDYWEKIGYTADEFLKFYSEVFNYTLRLSKEGIDIAEGHACIFLDKILNHRAGNYTELISPCGAGLGQLAYNYDGSIYTCDEGRMLAEMGDTTFKIGNINMEYKELFMNPICKTVAHASCLESLPQCEECVYSPYCGVCPVINYYDTKTVFPTKPNSYRCKIYKGMLDMIFSTLYSSNEKDLLILKKWVGCSKY